jgi:hypothetical protein
VRWIPIAQDRDWAFARLDGALSFLARLAMPRYVGFSSAFPDVTKLVDAAEELDNRLLNEMTRDAFVSAARDLQAALTDSVIGEAVAGLPAAIAVVEGEALRTRLEARRDNLAAFAADYHALLARTVHVHGSPAGADTVRFEAAGRDRLTVRLVRGGRTVWERTLDTDETEHVILYLEDDDRVVGGSDLPVSVRIRSRATRQ